MARILRRSGLIARPAKKIDNVVWELSTGNANSLAAGNVGINFSSVGTAPTTLLRMRGEVIAALEGAIAPLKTVVVTMGIILVPEGSGTTVQFSPVTDANAPWVFWWSTLLYYTEYVVDVVGSTQAAMSRFVIDNKAMRRIRPDVEMQAVIENTTIDGAGTINCAYSIRWLQGF